MPDRGFSVRVPPAGPPRPQPFIISPQKLIGVGLLCTGYGVYLIKRSVEGDTLCPGTTFTDLPGGWFIGSGIPRQLPLPWAFWFLQ